MYVLLNLSLPLPFTIRWKHARSVDRAIQLPWTEPVLWNLITSNHIMHIAHDTDGGTTTTERDLVAADFQEVDDDEDTLQHNLRVMNGDEF